MDVSLLRRSKRLVWHDNFKEEELLRAKPEEEEDLALEEADDGNALAIIPVHAALSEYKIMGTSTLQLGSGDIAPQFPVNLVQAIATNFLNMPATLVTREVLEADDANLDV